MKNYLQVNRAIAAKKNFNFNCLQGSSSLKRVGLVLVMCLIAITQVWADDFSPAEMVANTGAGTTKSHITVKAANTTTTSLKVCNVNNIPVAQVSSNANQSYNASNSYIEIKADEGYTIASPITVTGNRGSTTVATVAVVFWAGDAGTSFSSITTASLPSNAATSGCSVDIAVPANTRTIRLYRKVYYKGTAFSNASGYSTAGDGATHSYSKISASVNATGSVVRRRMFLNLGGVWDGGQNYWVHTWGNATEDITMTRIGSTGYYYADVSILNNDIQYVRNSYDNQTYDLNWSGQGDKQCAKITAWHTNNDNSKPSESSWEIYHDGRQTFEVGNTVYYDNSITQWSNVYFRLGHWGNVEAMAMTKVAGTQNLYSYQRTGSDWSGYEVFNFANNSANGVANVYYPSNDKSSFASDQTNFARESLSSSRYYKGGSSYFTCKYSKYHNIDEISTYTVTSSGAHCTVTMKKYTADDGSTYDDLSSGGSVVPTQYVEVSVTPDAGYESPTIVAVNAEETATDGVYYITGNATFTASVSAIDYNVAYSAPSNGDYTIKVADGTAGSETKTANIGQTITLKATPSTGYSFTSWTITNTDNSTDITSSVSLSGQTETATFTMPAANVSIAATFTAIPVSAISLSPTSATMTVGGGTQTITPTVTPSNALDKAINWSSSNKDVATVNSSGVVTAVAPGTATITATAHDGSGITQTCAITVKATMAYDGNGSTSGSAPSDASSPYTKDSRVTVKEPGTLVKTDNIFVGWNTKANGSGTYYSPGASFAITENTKLYAQWRDVSGTTCPSTGGGTVFSLSMNSTVTGSDLSIGKGESKALASYATMSNGTASFSNINTSSDGKAKITKDSPNQLQFNGNDAMLALFLDCALAEGDEISFTGGNYELSFSIVPNRGTENANILGSTSSKSYTIPAESQLIGKQLIYVWRKTTNTFGITALTITRPASNHTITGAVNEAGYGTVSPASITVDDGSTISISDNVLTCDGSTLTATETSATAEYTYAFSSWTGVTHGASVTTDLTATAVFTRTANSYTLAWDKNGEGDDLTGTYDSGTTAYGTSIAKPDDATWSGYRFDGWNSADDGSGDDYTGTMPAADVTYYAQWTEEFTITHNLSKTTTESGTTAYKGEAYVATYVAAEGEGYVLPSEVSVYRGVSNITASCTWNKGAGTLSIPGAQITGDITITVRSVRAACSVTYESETPTSGSVPTDSKSYRYGDVVTVMGDNDMTLTGYDFRGWLNEDNDIFYQEGQTFIITDNVTLTAVWEPTSSGGGGTTIYKFQVKTGLGSSTTNISSSVTDASTYMSVLEGGTIPMSLSGNGNIQTKNDSALCLHSTSGLLKPTLTSPKEIKRGDIIMYRSTSNDIRLMVSTSYSATTDVTMPAGNKMVVTSSSMIGESVLNMTKNSSDAEIKYFEIYRPGEVLFYAEVNNGIGTGSIGSGTDETEQTAGAVASGHNLSYISGGKLYTKARSAGYVKGATNEIQLSDGASGTYIKVALDKALAAGDIILVSSIDQKYPLGITTSATYSTAIVGPYYVIPAESGMIGEKNIYLWKNSSNSNLRTVAVVRPGSGADTNFDVTFADGTAVTPASHDEWPDDIVGVPDGKKITVEDPITVGYAFLGWYDKPECGADDKGELVDLDDLTVTEDITLYAKWVVNEHTFTGAAGTTAWETDGNWASGEAPDTDYPYSYAQVYVKKPVEMADGTKERVGRVDLVNDSETYTGKLTINSGAMLIVYDKVNRIENWSTKARLATLADDIYLGSEFGDDNTTHRKGGVNGALVMGRYNGTGVNATVQFSCLAWFNSIAYNETDKWQATDVNQYIGIPFNELTPKDYDNHDPEYSYTSSMLYYYGIWDNRWYPMIGSDKMHPFTGYDILWIRGSQPQFDLQGELVASQNQTIDLRAYSGDYFAEDNETLLANSWAAPINIAKFEVEDFTNAEATIYMFNAGTGVDYGDIGWTSGKTTLPGQYSALPIEYVKAYYDEYEGFRTIPSMQSFSILSTSGATHSITLNYKRLVYEGAIAYKTVEPMHAPRRAPRASSKPSELRIAVQGASGLTDVVTILEREDFTDGFDNGWEASKLYGIWEVPTLYVVSEDGIRSIVAVPDVDGQELAFCAGTVDDVYTISFEYDSEAEPLYLYDKDTEIYTRVDPDATYSFVTTDKSDHNRFILTRNYSPAPAVTTGVDGGKQADDVHKVLINDKLYIIRGGHIYDATGAMVK